MVHVLLRKYGEGRADGKFLGQRKQKSTWEAATAEAHMLERHEWCVTRSWPSLVTTINICLVDGGVLLRSCYCLEMVQYQFDDVSSYAWL